MEELLFGCRYRATEKIGSGGMADVYKGIDSVLGRKVAVKVMHARFAADPAFVARFRREAQAAANLVSPNIVNIYDWGHDAPDAYYIVMEYVVGSDLKSIVTQDGALPSRTVADIGAQVCAALCAAHGYDVIHRDIKSQNIMVQPDGTVKVMDFGIARAGGSNLTQTGSVFGTAEYLSPEQALGQPLTSASDLYSLGVALYEAATGRVPFEGGSPVAVALKQVNERAVPPRVVNPDVDPGLESVIVKAMQKSTADRYVSADDLRRDLRAVAQGRPVIADEVLSGTNVAAAGAVPATAAATSAQSTAVMPIVSFSTERAPSGRPSARVSRPRRVQPWLALAALAALVMVGLGVALGMGLLGTRTTAVPNVVSTTSANAKAELEGAGLKLGGVKAVFDHTVKSGTVVSQSPKASATATSGSAVDLVVSKGLEMIAVPKVVGIQEVDAFKALEKAGFSPQALPSEFNQDVAAGVVYRQDPAGDQMVARGSVVNYVVSRGVEPTFLGLPWVNGNSGKGGKGRGND